MRDYLDTVLLGFLLSFLFLFLAFLIFIMSFFGKKCSYEFISGFLKGLFESSNPLSKYKPKE